MKNYCLYKIILLMTIGVILPAQEWVRVNSPTTDDIINIKFYTKEYGFILTNNKLYRTTDACKTWDTLRTKANAEFRKFVSMDDKKMYVVSKFGELTKTTDGGNSWIDLGRIGRNWITEMFFVNEMVGYASGHNSGADVVVGTPNDSIFIFKTTDGGREWIRRLIDIPPVYALYFKNDSVGWAGGTIVGTGSTRLDFTTNSGKNWSELDVHNTVYESIKKIIFTKHDVGWLLGLGPYMGKSLDKGKTWSNFYINIPVYGGSYIWDLSWYDEEIILCRNWGVFHSYDNGATFSLDSIEVKKEITSLSLYQHSQAYAGGKTGAMWKFLKETSDVNISAKLPESHRLFQNYPNPFNPVTKIKYSIANRTNVKIKLYDALGRLVDILLNAVREPGTYEIKIENRILASGIYFYNMQTGNFTDTKKMVVLR